MRTRLSFIWMAQLVVVLLCGFALKLHYSTAPVNQLRWILTPTTVLVELVSGQAFEFENHAGYVSGNRSFLIAASCAGVNFMITAFLMLSLTKLWKDRSQRIRWMFLPKAILFAYLATIVANALRISFALQMQQARMKIGWLDANQLHRLEGILVYFGVLVLLFVIFEKTSHRSRSGSDGSVSTELTNPFCLLRRCSFPVLIYYGTTLGLPLANGAYRANDFWEHALFVVLTPLLVIFPVAAIDFCKARIVAKGISALKARSRPRLKA